MKKAIRIKKKQSVRGLLFAMILVANFTFVGCEEIFSDIIQCAINIHPELPDQQLKEGKMGESYYDEVRASMINEPNNDYYYYNFNISGTLPEGIVIGMDGRTVFIGGTPVQSGRYIIKINVEVEPYDEEIFLCDNSAYHEYVLLIK